MIPLCSVEQVRTAEANAVAAGRDEPQLMRAAADGIARTLRDHYDDRRPRLLVLAGPGKNGGDGLVATDLLAQEGWTCSAFLYERNGFGELPADPQIEERVQVVSEKDLDDALVQADIVMDAVFGLGSRPDIPDSLAKILERVAEARCQRSIDVWAIDVPSGINSDSGETADTTLRANYTAMIGLPKIGAYRFPAAALTGRIHLVDIELESPAESEQGTPQLLIDQSARLVLPERRAGLHKRSAGTVMVIGGAPHYYGAPRLAAHAALRTGSGLVSVAAPSSVIGAIASAVPELVFIPLPMAEHGRAGERMASQVRKHLHDSKALVIGPGLGIDDPVPDFLARLLGMKIDSRRGIGFGADPGDEEREPFSGAAVIDADALTWLATRPGWEEDLRDASLVLTPHPAELARLLGCEVDDVLADPWQVTLDAAAEFGQVVVLKHGHSVVAAPDGQLSVAPQAPPSLATAGSGDVLAGVIGSFLGQGLSSYDAARAGVVVGLRATEMAEELHGPVGLLASDIIDQLSKAVSNFHR